MNLFNNTLLKECRKQRGLTQLEASQKLGIARTTYADYEKGKIQPPIDKLQRISMWLDIPTERLMQANNDTGIDLDIFKKWEDAEVKNVQIIKRIKAKTDIYESFDEIPEKNILENYILNHIKPELEKYKVEYEVKQAQIDKKDIAQNLVKCRNKLEKLKDLYLDDLIDKNAYKVEYVRLNDMIAELETQQEDDKDISHIDDILSMDFESIYHTLEDTEKRYLWQSIIDHIDIGNNRNDITIYFK